MDRARPSHSNTRRKDRVEFHQGNTPLLLAYLHSTLRHHSSRLKPRLHYSDYSVTLGGPRDSSGQALTKRNPQGQLGVMSAAVEEVYLDTYSP